LRDGLILAVLAAAPFAVPLALLGAGFVRPWGIALYGLALPLVLLHMLRPRRTRRTIGSVLLWKEVELALDARHPFERLRRNLALLLELLALAALSVALATPRLRGGGGSAHDVVIVLDASASMKTRDALGGATRFEAAIDAAKLTVAGLRSGQRACIFVATPRGARTAQGWTEDASALEDALRSLEPSDGAADLGDALVLAAAAARPLAEGAEVLLLSDGGGPPIPALDWKGKLRYKAIGSSDENLGIVAAERSSDEASPSVLVSVLNAGSRARKAFVELLQGEALAEGARPVARKTLAARAVELAPRSRAAVVLEASLSPGVVTARISPSDGAPDLLASDDEVALVLPESRAGSVALIGSSRPIARALEAARVRVSGTVSEETRLAVFVGAAPEKLPKVSCLLVNPATSTGPVTLGDSVTSPRITAWDRQDRLLRFVSFDDVALRRARRLEGTRCRTLVASDVGPLVVAWSEGELARVLVGFDLADSSWPLRLSFPIFVENCVLAAFEDEALGPRSVVRAGSVVTLRAASSEVVVTTPRGREVRVPVEEGRALFAETDVNGVYRVRAGARETVFAVATLDEAESRIAPRAVLEVGSEGVSGEGALDPGEREVVVPFLLVALLALLLEGFAFHRRW
jgi:hypothetical protein